MTHTYHISGMTCSSCESTVKNRLSIIHGITGVEVNRQKEQVTIHMTQHISIDELQKTLGENSKYRISAQQGIAPAEPATGDKSWFATYKPVLLLFFYISLVSGLYIAVNHQGLMAWMNLFMAGFFIAFSFFKLLNLRGFAESYAMYDILAALWKPWGYVYAFIELGLGLAYLTGFRPVLVNSIMVVVMTLSLVGVLKSVLNKRKIRCACLGDVFDLPMSTLTILEDSIMIMMGIITLLLMNL